MKATDVICPKCLAGVYQRCRTLTTGRVTDTHQARYEVLNATRTERRL